MTNIDPNNNLRGRLRQAQRGKCCYCGKTMLARGSLKPNGKPHPLSETIEHLRRKADGGTNHPDNKALACLSCNNKRGSMDWLTYKSLKMGELAA